MLLYVIKKARDGDHESMMELITRFSPLIRKYARILNYEDAYEDLLVEFIDFIYTFKVDNIKEKNDGVLVNYICKVLRNKYIKLSKYKSTLYAAEVHIDDLPDSQKFMVENSMVEPPNELLSLKELLPNNLLTKYQQRVILLHYYYGVPISLIAKQEGVTRQNVNKAKNAALRKLKKMMIR